MGESVSKVLEGIQSIWRAYDIFTYDIFAAEGGKVWFVETVDFDVAHSLPSTCLEVCI